MKYSCCSSCFWKSPVWPRVSQGNCWPWNYDGNAVWHKRRAGQPGCRLEHWDEPGADELTAPTLLQMQRGCGKRAVLYSSRKVNKCRENSSSEAAPAWKQPIKASITAMGKKKVARIAQQSIPILIPIFQEAHPMPRASKQTEKENPIKCILARKSFSVKYPGKAKLIFRPSWPTQRGVEVCN